VKLDSGFRRNDDKVNFMKKSHRHKPLWLQAAPAIFLLLWSLGFPVARICLQYVEPMTFLALRYGLVLAILAPLFLALKPPLPARSIDWLHLAVTGFLIQVVYFGFCYLAFAMGETASTVALIVSLQPILVALLAPGLAGEQVGAVRWAGLLCGLAGAIIVILTKAEGGATSNFGLALIILALFGMTGAALYEKRFGGAYHPVTANLVQYAVGLIGTLPVAFFLESSRVQWTGPFIASLAYLVIANSIVSVTLLLAMIRQGEVARVSALFFLVPPLTAILSWAMIGEIIEPLAWPGIVLAALGVALASWPAAAGKRLLSSLAQK
jgi:drug/metabolite transporter (DMT)-like permease